MAMRVLCCRPPWLGRGQGRGLEGRSVAMTISSQRFLCQSEERKSLDKIALVTGASGVIGQEICFSLASQGCKVIVHYHSNNASAERVVQEINSNWSHLGSEGYALQADCSNYQSTKGMFDQIQQKYGTLDILVNNAGIKLDKLSIKMQPEDFTHVLNTNLNSTFYCSQLAFSMMMRKKSNIGGRIINISSIVGQVGNIGQVNYATSKGGIIAMTRSLAKEYAMRNVCVNAVCPGYIESDMVRGLYTSSPEESRKLSDVENEKMEKLIQSIPLRRLGKPSDVASLVRFLALDPAGGYMTGHCLNIDGGVAIGVT